MSSRVERSSGLRFIRMRIFFSISRGSYNFKLMARGGLTSVYKGRKCFEMFICQHERRVRKKTKKIGLNDGGNLRFFGPVFIS